jgi:hypothetical protein
LIQIYKQVAPTELTILFAIHFLQTGRIYDAQNRICLLSYKQTAPTELTILSAIHFLQTGRIYDAQNRICILSYKQVAPTALFVGLFNKLGNEFRRNDLFVEWVCTTML